MNNQTYLLNLNEEIPKVFFVFVNFNNHITKHNLEITKGFSSGAVGQIEITNSLQKYLDGNIDYLPFIPNPNCELISPSMFNINITSEYITEYNCELYRRYNHKIFPSRFSAIFAFGEYETCVKVSKKYGWDINTVRKFKLEPTPLNRVIKVNMEIISTMRHAECVSMIDQNNHNLNWKEYWTGGGEIQTGLPTVKGTTFFNSDIIWEYLIEGRLTLIED
jgi:hypothetical protein